MKVFYQDYKFDEDIRVPEETNMQTALKWFYELTDESDNFFGIVDDYDKCIQFMCLGVDKWLVEIPLPPDFRNYQKIANYEECVSMIKEVYRQNCIIVFKDMQRVNTM